MFQEEIATAVAGFYLQRAPHHELNDLKLMKLLYLSEREALITLGAPIMEGRYASLPNGPVVHELLNWTKPRGIGPTWDEHIRFIPHDGARSNHLVLIKEIDASKYVSDAELRLLESVWARYRHRTKWEMVDMTHEFPEWDEAVADKGAPVKSKKIDLLDILVKGFEVPPAEASSLVAFLEAQNKLSGTA